MAERLPRVREPLPLTLAVARHRAIVRQDEAASGMWVVESGALLVTMVAPDGRALALDILGPGDAVGEPDGGISPATVRTLRPSRLRPVQPAAQPKLLAARASRLAAMALDLAWLDVPTRVSRRLDDLAARFGRETPTGVRITLALTQDDIAALTGATRESVNRAIRGMERRRRIATEGRGRYVLARSQRAGTTSPGRS